MSKKLLADAVKRETGCTNADALAAVEAVIAEILFNLDNGEKRFSVRGLGSLKTKTTKPRKCRNPLTGETVMVPAKSTVKFTPAAALVRVLEN
jgi:DNA-binding protein HU-beta